MSPDSPRRERVVLSQRRGARPVRTRAEVAEQTRFGEHLVRSLVRAQLGLALRIGLAVVVVLLAIPVAGSAIDGFASATLFGITLNWIVLALLPYPVLYLAGRIYIRLAEQAERDFIKLMDDEEQRRC
ncbi:hypothetical protein GOHSU_14_01440 [Gordonia hirsuta DSM 44140 = NBRC 16056]|uniref:Uncharacterized protein n=1 Tax=Gordonia hirsuta DSM 44140 = NBRC 16056 TaxID=1121927 RepID=L7LAA7_9ACTN|nr:hypothetical protein [Gordonia hirsuta]GAC56977.1 hypothetical protein GOHSU_14_01440 [Gordonia hirsuta DSM 44140 = NBRC 16056]